ncbi:MAG TPA: right-handed parallel beta-helix repeat-containing protein [Polyangiaceae bacterium]
MRRWAASVVALAVVSGATACASILGVESGVLDTDSGAADGEADTTMDAGDDGDSGAHDAPSDLPKVGDAMDAEASTGSTAYVSVNGADTNSGLDPSQPKKTLAAGLILAATLPGVPTVNVCAARAGTTSTPYTENLLAIGRDVRLLGGWDCTFQTRNPSMYPTVVNNGAPASQSATLFVALSGTGSTISSKTVIDGFTINGGSASTSMSVGVDVTGSVSPVLSNDVITGGGGTAASSDSWGSVGVRVADGATPEITNCVIHAGSGSGPTGSAGIGVELSGNPTIRQDVVTGGSGVGAFGAVGIHLHGTITLSNPIAGVLVYGSDAEEPFDAGMAVPASSNGILVDGGASVTIESSVILGGTAATQTCGVNIQHGGTVTLTANRIYGGDNTQSASFGVLVQGTSGPLTIANSEIHAGIAPALYADAVALDQTTAPAIVDSTIYVGQGGAAIDLGQTTGASIRNDLLLGSGNAGGSTGVQTGTCSSIANLDHTGFANLGTYYTCKAGSATFTASDLGGLLNICPQLGMNCTGDVQIGDSANGVACSGAGCVADPSCPSTPATTCLASVFGAWTNDGANIFSPPAADGGVDGGTFADWAVLSQYAQVVCGGMGESGISTDLLGNKRSTTGSTSMGAVVTPSSACPQ